ncbi:hypothetical protein ACJX0J_018748, partial [Zea mays]
MSEVEWASEASMLDIVTGNHKEWEYGTASDQSLSDPFDDNNSLSKIFESMHTILLTLLLNLFTFKMSPGWPHDLYGAQWSEVKNIHGDYLIEQNSTRRLSSIKKQMAWRPSTHEAMMHRSKSVLNFYIISSAYSLLPLHRDLRLFCIQHFSYEKCCLQEHNNTGLLFFGCRL